MTDTKNTLTAEQAFSAYMQGKEIWDKDGQFWGESRSAGSSINKFIDAAPFRLAEIPTPKTEGLEPEEALALFRKGKTLISARGDKWVVTKTFAAYAKPVSLAEFIADRPYRLVENEDEAEQPSTKEDNSLPGMLEEFLTQVLREEEFDPEIVKHVFLQLIRSEARKIAQEAIKNHAQYGHATLSNEYVRTIAREIADKQIDIYAQAHAKARSYDYHGWTKEHGFGDAENGPEAKTKITDPIWEKPTERK